MSTLYNVEPNPTAKCILRTTSGDLLLELFAQQAPLASRNFLQHCLDGYYNGTIFHRLVPGFIIQGGDPTGTGFGGQSALEGGRPFKDEFHSRLRFNRRGLLGMANGGEKDDNGSQFFLTLGDTKDLNGKHTMFGRMAGDTIYNLLKMGDAELTEAEGSERPMFPTKITGSEVLVNPFEDMVARKQVDTSTVEDDQKQPTKKRKRKPAGKQMLSFGGDDGDAGGEDMLPTNKATKFNPKLVRLDEPATRDEPKRSTKAAAIPKANIDLTGDDDQPRQSSKTTDKSTSLPRPPSPPPRSPNSSASDSEVEITKSQRKSKAALESTNAQIAGLKQSLKRTIPLVQADDATEEARRRKTPLEMMIPKGATRGRKRPGQNAGQTAGSGASKEEQRALKLFKAFGQKLEVANEQSVKRKAEQRPSETRSENNEEVNEGPKPGVDINGGDNLEEAPLCDLHFIPNCQSCAKWDAADHSGESDNDADGLGLMSHTLTFAKDRLGKSLEWKRQNEEQLVVIDPREKARTIKNEKQKGRTSKA